VTSVKLDGGGGAKDNLDADDIAGAETPRFEGKTVDAGAIFDDVVAVLTATYNDLIV
jgi:hypothetical protein